MSSPTEIEIAWAAGLFEGEGCISSTARVGPTRGRNRVLAMAMTDLDVLQRFHRIVGVGYLRARPMNNEKWKDQWEWRCGRWEDILYVLVMLGPHLCARRQVAAAEMIASPPLGRGIRERCVRGHPYFGPDANFRVDHRGSKVCLTCQRDPEIRRRKNARTRELRALRRTTSSA